MSSLLPQSSPTSPVSTRAGSGNDGRLPERSQSLPVPVGNRLASGFNRLLRRRKTIHIAQEWEHHGPPPYHDYIRQLVLAGWNNLLDLDTYMTNATANEGLVVSVFDIFSDSKRKEWPELYNERDLKQFMDTNADRHGANVRFYLAEYEGYPSPALIETLGSSLNLDPRFFQWIIHNRGHMFTPSERHNFPYMAIGFGILRDTTPSVTDAEKFKVMVYIQPDETGWTAVILFNSCTKHNISTRVLTSPPTFLSPRPPPIIFRPKAIRELYLESFSYLDLAQVTTSPFYAISNLLRLNCFCWNQIITAIREQDRLISGISDTSVGHTEEIKRSLAIVLRAGSFAWAGKDLKVTRDSQDALEEDFRHLVEQTDLLWQTRRKIAEMRQSKSEARWTALVNAFTYLFAPLTIMTGIYGMNVSEFSGNKENPDIWQFFVAVIAMNFVMVMILASYNLISIHYQHGRIAGIREIVGFAVGRTPNAPQQK